MRLVSCDPREDGTPMIALECSRDELRDDDITIGMGSIMMSTERAVRLRDMLCRVLGMPDGVMPEQEEPLPCEPEQTGLYWTRDHSALMHKDSDGDWTALDLTGDGEEINDFFGDGVTYALRDRSDQGWPLVVRRLGRDAFPLERLRFGREGNAEC